MNFSPRKLIDLLALIIIILSASFLSIIFNLNFLYSTVLFLGAPVVYLYLRLDRPTQKKRILAMATIFGIWHGYVFAYIANWNSIWAWPEESLSWGWLLGVNPIEWIWVALWITFIVLFYEKFIERDTKSAVSHRIWWAIIPIIFMTSMLYVFTVYVPTALTWPYAYAVLSVLMFPPVIVLLFKNAAVFKKIGLSMLFFIPVHIVHEITGVMLNHWYFPGEYFWIVPLPGNTHAPVEEFFIWILLGSFVVLSYYELYVDDGK